MNIETNRLLFDFGMLVLIWLVQLVIYPSFFHYQIKDLKQWHEKYIVRITYVVMPLMIGQLSLTIVMVFDNLGIYQIGSLILIVVAWLSTFLQFVPMHNKITMGVISDDVLHKLLRNNWLRTILWTIIFIWSFVWYINHV